MNDYLSPGSNPDVLTGLVMRLTRTPEPEPIIPGTPEYAAYRALHPLSSELEARSCWRLPTAQPTR